MSEKDIEKKFLEIYNQYIDKIYRFVIIKVNHKETAEDITSEVFLKLWQSFLKGKEIRHISGFLYRVTRNLVTDFYRKSNKTNLELEETTSFSNLQEELLKDDTLSFILKNLKKLSSDYQDLIILRYIEGFEVSEISEILNKSQSAVRVQLSRAIQALKKELNQN